MSESSQESYETLTLFNCFTCGCLMCFGASNTSGDKCNNCGASYDGDRAKVTRYGKGRPPTQWHSNGWNPPDEPKEKK